METVSHKGRVTDVSPQFVTVEIVSESACASCHAAGLCSMSERKKKTIEVPVRGFESFEAGQEVNVVIKASMGRKAVLLAYVAPLVVLVAVLLGMLAAGLSEVVSGLSAIAATGVYYFVIWLLKDKLRDGVDFTIDNNFNQT